LLYSGGGIDVPSGSAKARQHQAFTWWKQAAELGNAQAQNNVGTAYANGDGAPHDAIAALMWLHRSARQGVPEAQHNLATCLLKLPEHTKQVSRRGKQIALLSDEVVFWAVRSAKQGYSRGLKLCRQMQLMRFVNDDLFEINYSVSDLDCYSDDDNRGGGGGHGGSTEGGVLKDSTTPVCPGGHVLMTFSTPNSDYGCDKCTKDMPVRSIMYGCGQCHYHLCSPCSKGGADVATKLTSFTELPNGTPAIVLEFQNILNLRPGMRIVLKFSDDKHNEEPRWAWIKRIKLPNRTRCSVAKLSLLLDVQCEQPATGGGLFMTSDLDNFYICNQEHGTQWCVYAGAENDAGDDEHKPLDRFHADDGDRGMFGVGFCGPTFLTLGYDNDDEWKEEGEKADEEEKEAHAAAKKAHLAAQHLADAMMQQLLLEEDALEACQATKRATKGPKQSRQLLR
jgi:Na+-translocating ferredoxin:NAD+ oxidoreductase RNF subunit RnfB